MPRLDGRAARGWLPRLNDRAGEGSLLLDHSRRRHLAILVTVLIVSVFGFVLLQPRKVRVEADGRDVTLSTHLANNAAVLAGIGVRVAPGDRVTALDGGSGIDVLKVERAHDVTLRADGLTYHLHTHALTIDQLLAEASIAVGDRDSVLQDGALVSLNAPVEPPQLFASRTALDSARPLAGAVVIDVRRAVPFTVDEDGHEIVSSSSRPTVAQALREAGLTVGPGDRVTPDLQAPLVTDTRIELLHAKAVTVTLPNDHQVIYTFERTVGDALRSANIALPAGAFTEPPLETAVSPGMSVRVVQLSASRSVEREYVANRTVYKVDPNLAPGETRAVAGHDGVRVRRYDVAYVNGHEVSRTLLDESYDPPPVDTIVFYPPQRGAGDAPGSLQVARTLNVYATWYNAASSGRSSSDPAYGHTATGAIVTYGIVAVDPTVIPLGTKMFIPGYGYAVAADTGGAVKGYIIDLGYPDGVTVDWRSKWLDIYILS
ncbi:MAG TPA: ubiquitin-like domain-containing protein [Dehalococcoidia bacterium]|nr:ubiquitin-like domain-containing protein [Dehalococcoidia bacterium]